MVTCPSFSLYRILTFFLLLISTSALAQDTTTLERLDYQLLHFEEGVLAPLTFPEREEVAGLFLSCEDTKLLEFCGNKQFSIWVDGKFLVENQKGCLTIQSTRLCKDSTEGSVFLSIVSKANLSGITIRSLDIQLANKGNTQNFLTRSLGDNFEILGFVMLAFVLVGSFLLVGVSMWTFPKSPYKNFSGGVFTRENLWAIIIIVLLLSFSMTLLQLDENGRFLLNRSLLIVSIIFVKGIIVLLSGAIFKIQKFASWQLQAHLRFWLFAAVGFYALLFVDFLFFAQEVVTGALLNTLLLLSASVIFLVIAGTFMLGKSMKKLHIFIYLCTTEILAIILLVDWFLE